MVSLIRRSPGCMLGVLALFASFCAHADIVVGQVAPFSGPQAVTGKAICAGIRLYFDAVNAQGGVKGERIRLVTRDDGQKVDETLKQVKELIETESPVALIGTVGTANLEALKQDGILLKKRVSMVGAISGAASVASSRGMYPVKAGYRDEVARLFSQLSPLGRTRVGIVYQDDALGQDVLAGVETAAKTFGITLVGKAGHARNTVDVGRAVGQMRSASPDVILLGTTTAAAIEFMRRYSASGGRAPLYGLSIIDTTALLAELGPDRARGYGFSTVLPLAQKQDNELVREYQSLSRAMPNKDLSARSIEGYIAAKVLVKALERIPRPTAEALTGLLEAGLDMDLGGYRLAFSHPGRPPSLYVDLAVLGDRGQVLR